MESLGRWISSAVEGLLVQTNEQQFRQAWRRMWDEWHTIIEDRDLDLTDARLLERTQVSDNLMIMVSCLVREVEEMEDELEERSQNSINDNQNASHASPLSASGRNRVELSSTSSSSSSSSTSSSPTSSSPTQTSSKVNQGVSNKVVLNQQPEPHSAGPCLDYLLTEGIFEQLVAMGIPDQPSGIRGLIIHAVDSLIRGVCLSPHRRYSSSSSTFRPSHALLANMQVHTALTQFIDVCVLRGDLRPTSPNRSTLISLLAGILHKVAEDPSLLPLFFVKVATDQQRSLTPTSLSSSTEASTSSSSSTNPPPSQSLLRDSFPVFDTLVTAITTDTEDSTQTLPDALLAITSLPSLPLHQYITQSSPLCINLALSLATRFEHLLAKRAEVSQLTSSTSSSSSLTTSSSSSSSISSSGVGGRSRTPSYTDPPSTTLSTTNTSVSHPHLPIVSSRLRTSEYSSILSSFIERLVFIDVLATSGKISLAQHLANELYSHVFLPLLHPLIMSVEENTACWATDILTMILQRIQSKPILSTLVFLTLGRVSAPIDETKEEDEERAIKAAEIAANYAKQVLGTQNNKSSSSLHTTTPPRGTVSTLNTTTSTTPHTTSNTSNTTDSTNNDSTTTSISSPLSRTVKHPSDPLIPSTPFTLHPSSSSSSSSSTLHHYSPSSVFLLPPSLVPPLRDLLIKRILSTNHKLALSSLSFFHALLSLRLPFVIDSLVTRYLLPLYHIRRRLRYAIRKYGDHAIPIPHPDTFLFGMFAEDDVIIDSDVDPSMSFITSSSSSSKSSAWLALEEGMPNSGDQESGLDEYLVDALQSIEAGEGQWRRYTGESLLNKEKIAWNRSNIGDKGDENKGEKSGGSGGGGGGEDRYGAGGARSSQRYLYERRATRETETKEILRRQRIELTMGMTTVGDAKDSNEGQGDTTTKTATNNNHSLDDTDLDEEKEEQQDGDIQFDEGPFLHALLNKLESAYTNTFEVNLALTGVISLLAHSHHPLIKSYLLDSRLCVRPEVRTVLGIAAHLWENGYSRGNQVNAYQERLHEAFNCLSPPQIPDNIDEESQGGDDGERAKDKNKERDNGVAQFLETQILIREFIKEMYAICRVHYDMGSIHLTLSSAGSQDNKGGSTSASSEAEPPCSAQSSQQHNTCTTLSCNLELVPTQLNFDVASTT